MGAAKLCHAIAPTKGLRKKGIKLNGSILSRQGQLVRALIHASNTPKKLAKIVVPVLMIRVFIKALRITRP